MSNLKNKLNELDKELSELSKPPSPDLHFLQKRKDDRGIYLLYIISTIDEDKIIRLNKKYCDDFVFKRNTSRNEWDELKETYGFDEYKVESSDMRLLNKYGKDLILITPKTINQQL